MATPDKLTTLRNEVDQAIAGAAWNTAFGLLAELWREQKSPSTAAFIVGRFQKLRGHAPLLEYRVAILRSFTVEPALPILQAAALCSGIDLKIHCGEFNAYQQEILDRDSALYRFAPNAVILAVRTADIAPDLWHDYSDMDAPAVEAAAQRVVHSFGQSIAAFRERCPASLIVHTLEQPFRPNAGLLDDQLETCQSGTVRRINREIGQAARRHPGVYVLDYDSLVARHGRRVWRDERKWLLARMPIAADQLVHLAEEWLRFLIPLTGRVAKALVVDLDNTLWGGVIGEDGINGIKLGPEYPGAAYQALQRAMLDLSRRGILLAVCSKNNPEDAMEALEKHPGMLLRLKSFAAMRINWTDKAQNLREIAAELNIGVDSLAFIDDNPFECQQVRAALPEVTVIDLPGDPMQFEMLLRECPAFERLTLSAEDQKRTELYAEQRERVHAEEKFQSKEDFFRYLQQEAEIAPVQPATLARIAQLTQKTNQFNLTTRRYTETQISDFAARPGWQVVSIRVRDRFGDHGLVGVAITRDEQDACEIDTFLLSCRVIGRSVESALLFYLSEQARARGCHRLAGWFLPTKKNAPAREFYAQHGFKTIEETGEGAYWAFDLGQAPIASPEWVKLTIVNGAKP